MSDSKSDSKSTWLVRRWYLDIAGERFRFSTKRLAVIIGRQARALDDSVRLIEEYDLFAVGPSWSEARGKHIDHQEFDRTTLLTT